MNGLDSNQRCLVEHYKDMDGLDLNVIFYYLVDPLCYVVL